MMEFFVIELLLLFSLRLAQIGSLLPIWVEQCVAFLV